MKLISLYHVAFIKTIIVIYVANIFDFLLYHVAIKTTVIVFLRGTKEHRRMKVIREYYKLSLKFSPIRVVYSC